MRVKDFARPLILLAVLSAFIAVVYVFSGDAFHITGASFGGRSEKIPEYTPEVASMLEKSTGFQYLVSYTDNGFEPSDITIRKGETIRFTNNSSHKLWVAAHADEDAGLYPGGINECGQSAFDMCRSIGRGEFWEFTFAETGAWSFHNMEDVRMKGMIRVE